MGWERKKQKRQPINSHILIGPFCVRGCLTDMWGLVDAKLIRVSTAMHRFASASSLPPPAPATAAAAAAQAAALRFGSAATTRVPRALALTASTCPWHRRHLCSSSSSSSSSAAAAAATAAAVEEARQGRKQLGATTQLYEYLLANVREHPVRVSLPPLSAWFVSSKFCRHFGVRNSRHALLPMCASVLSRAGKMHQVLKELREETAAMRGSQMQVRAMDKLGYSS